MVNCFKNNNNEEETINSEDRLQGVIQGLRQQGKIVNKLMDNEKMIRDVRKKEELEELKKSLIGYAPSKKSGPVFEKKKTIGLQKKSTLIKERKGNKNESIIETSVVEMIVSSKLKSEKMMKMAASIKESNIGVSSVPIKMQESSKRSEKENKKTWKIYNKQRKAADTISFEVPSLTYESSPPQSFMSPFTPTAVSTDESSIFSNSAPGGIVLEQEYIIEEEEGKPEKRPMKVFLKQNVKKDGSFDVLLVYLDEKKKEVMNVSLTMHGDDVQNVKFNGKKVNEI